MNDQEKQELNEKIARWCGFEYFATFNDEKLYLYGTNCGIPCPDFLDPIKGLGLLFRYAEPILDDYSLFKYGINHNASVKKNNKWARVVDKDPTTALALAIGKLIDEGEG